MKKVMNFIALCRHEWICLRHLGLNQWDLEQRHYHQ